MSSNYIRLIFHQTEPAPAFGIVKMFDIKKMESQSHRIFPEV